MGFQNATVPTLYGSGTIISSAEYDTQVVLIGQGYYYAHAIDNFLPTTNLRGSGLVSADARQSDPSEIFIEGTASLFANALNEINVSSLMLQGSSSVTATAGVELSSWVKLLATGNVSVDVEFYKEPVGQDIDCYTFHLNRLMPEHTLDVTKCIIPIPVILPTLIIRTRSRYGHDADLPSFHYAGSGSITYEYDYTSPTEDIVVVCFGEIESFRFRNEDVNRSLQSVDFEYAKKGMLKNLKLMAGFERDEGAALHSVKNVTFREKFDTSSVTDMSWLLSDMGLLESLDISNLSFDSCTTLEYAFSCLTNCETMTIGSHTNPVLVNARYAFRNSGCETIDASGFGVSNVQNFTGMFSENFLATSIDVSTFNTSSGVSLGSMFEGNTSMTSIDVSSFVTSKVISFANMFRGCSTYAGELDLSNFSTESAALLEYMFYYMRKVEHINISGMKMNESTSIKHRQMFQDCVSLKCVSNINTIKSNDRTYIFKNNPVLAAPTVAERAQISSSNGMDWTSTFAPGEDCSPPLGGHIRYFTTQDVTFNTGTRSPTNGYIDIIGNDTVYPTSGQLSVTKVEVLKYGLRTSWLKLCHDCSNMTILKLSATDESIVTSFDEAWHGCTNLSSFDLIDTSKGTSFGSSWKGCASLASFKQLDFSNATNLANAWESCTNLISFPVIDTSKVTRFDHSWSNCSKLTSVGPLDVRQGINFEYTWNGCSLITSVTGLHCHGVTNKSNFNSIFRGTAKLVSISDSSFDQVDKLDIKNMLFNYGNNIALKEFINVSFAKVTTLDGSEWDRLVSLEKMEDINFSSLLTYSSTNNTNSLDHVKYWKNVDMSSATDITSAWSSYNTLLEFSNVDLSSVIIGASAWSQQGTLQAFKDVNLGSLQNFSNCWQLNYQLAEFSNINISSGNNFSGTWKATSLPSCPLTYLSHQPSPITDGNTCG